MVASVRPSTELTRIKGLNWRTWSDEDAAELAELLTEKLRKPGGEWTLLPWQAVAIAEAFDAGGLFCQAPVGAGKTIPTCVIPEIIGAKRPVLLIKASLRHKTQADFEEISKHFKIHEGIQLVNYELLSSPRAQKILKNLNPDVIIADEVQELRNLDATRTKRLFRYLHENPHVKCFFLSGSMARNSIKDYWHLIGSALPSNSPLPYKEAVADQWAQALDARIPSYKRLAPGALLSLCAKEDMLGPGTPLEKARRGLNRRMTGTLGVVIEESGSCDQPLTLKERPLTTPRVVADALAELRETWTTSNGEEIMEAKDLARKARENIVGYDGVWDPQAPKSWLEPRSTWAKFVRGVLAQDLEHLDSKFFVAKAFSGSEQYREWEAVRKSFVPNPVPIWMSDYMIQDAAKWMVGDGTKDSGGIVWVQHVAAGEALSALTGFRYFGGGKRNAKAIRETAEKRHIGPIICSIAAHSVGRNLQSYNRALILAPPPNGTTWEQTIGRIHRQGQKRPCFVETYLHEPELVDSLLTAELEAKFAGAASSQKLITAKWVGLEDLQERATDVWRRKNG